MNLSKAAKGMRAFECRPGNPTASMREGIRAHLNLDGHGFHALAAFPHPRRTVAARDPQSAAFPAGVRIVDAAVKALGEEAGRIGHLDGDHLPVLEGEQ